MKKRWICGGVFFFFFFPQVIYFDLKNLAILLREACSEGKSNPSPASILHYSYLLIM